MALKRITLGSDSSGRPLVLDERTHAKYREACRRLGFALTIVQGSYRGTGGAAASAGTHNRGGVIDIRTWNIPAEIGVTRVVRVLRECGLIAWYRTKAQGFDPHIHAIDHGNPELDPSAAAQVTQWRNGTNGLRSRGPDDGPRIPVPTEVPEEDDLPYTEQQIAALVRAGIREETSGIVTAFLTRDLYDDDRTVTVAKALKGRAS